MNPGKERPYTAMVPIRVGVFCVLLLFAGTFGWAASSQISGALVVSGRVEVAQNRQAIQHEKGGVVVRISAQEGMTVQQGDVLLELDTSSLRLELAQQSGQYYEKLAQLAFWNAVQNDLELEALKEDLYAQAVPKRIADELALAQNTRFVEWRLQQTMTRATAAKQQAQIVAQIKGLNLVYQSLQAQLTLIALDVADQQSLFARGLAAAATVRAVSREQVRLRGALAEVAATRSRADARMAELEFEENRANAAAKEHAIKTYRELADQTRSLKLEREILRMKIDAMTLRAPSSGILHNVAVNTLNAVISAGQTVMYLIPHDRPLVITASVRPADIAQVSLGQNVSLHFTELEREETTDLFGEILLVSADIFEDRRTGTAYFHIEIGLGADQRALLPKDKPLRLGMPVEAHILTDSRTPLSFVLKPMTDYFARAFRES
jgi:HlyD family type I secretion membrane fusion protein